MNNESAWEMFRRLENNYSLNFCNLLRLEIKIASKKGLNIFFAFIRFYSEQKAIKIMAEIENKIINGG